MCVVHLSLAQLAVIPQAILIEMIFHVFGMFDVSSSVEPLSCPQTQEEWQALQAAQAEAEAALQEDA